MCRHECFGSGFSTQGEEDGYFQELVEVQMREMGDMTPWNAEMEFYE
jgi:hypothetical protein